MATTRNDREIVLELPLRPYELIAAWRGATRTLVLVVQQQVQLQARLQARISVLGLGVSATITGRAVGVREHPFGAEVEVEPDATRARALEALVEVAQGAPVTYRNRAPRWLAALPAVVFGSCGPTEMRTFAVSENGCGLAWSGPLPDVGVPMEIRLGAGRQVASFCGEVCWTAPSGRVPTVGLKFAAGDRTTWVQMLAELQRAGAPPA